MRAAKAVAQGEKWGDAMVGERRDGPRRRPSCPIPLLHVRTDDPEPTHNSERVRHSATLGLVGSYGLTADRCGTMRLPLAHKALRE